MRPKWEHGVGNECTAIHWNEHTLGRHPTKDRLTVRKHHLPQFPTADCHGREAVMPALFDGMHGGDLGKTNVDVAG
ncbi:MAG TPA: hypothetical protein VH084_25160 [Mycobacterium sp.]|jgi:hypothetical protein|nr:hypothetical protein [Mycobacterium sp.]